MSQPILLKSIRVLAICFFAGLFAQSSLGQLNNIGPDIARPTPGVGHNYIHLLSETVNPANGSINLQIALPVPGSRGFSLPLALTYNSGQVNHFISALPGSGGLAPDSVTSLSSGGWGDTFPYVSENFWRVQPAAAGASTAECQFSASYNFYDPSGVSHPLGLSAMSYPQQTSGNAVGANFCGTFGYFASTTGGDDEVQAKAGENCNGLTTSGIPDPPSCSYGALDFTVTQLDGTVYSFPYNTPNAPLNYPAITVFSYPTTIEDRNGNISTYSVNATTGVRTITDTIGRTITSNGPAGFATSYEAGGLTYSVGYTTASAHYTLPSQQVAPISASVGCNVNLTVPNNNPAATYPVPDTGVANVIQTITLPNKQTYTFHYESVYGLLSEIDYPNGGWVKYTWKLNDTLSDLLSFNGEKGGTSFSNGCNVLYKTPALDTRTVGYSSGSTPAQTQTFTYATNWDSTSPAAWDSKITTVTTKDNIVGNSTTTIYTYGGVLSISQPDGGGSSTIPIETSVRTYDWSNSTTPLITVNKTWIDQYQMTSEQTSLENGPSSENVYCYVPGTDLVAEKDEYGYGTSSPSYSQPLFSASTNPPCGQPTPTRKTTFGSYVFGTPCQVIVYDANGNRAAETDAYFDGSASVCGTGGATTTAVSGLVKNTHDETNYGPNSTATRGNITKLVKWANVGPSSTTTYSFDETGQVTTSTDACGNVTCIDMTGTSHTTSYSYIDEYVVGTPTGVTNAYLTLRTGPSTNGVIHKSSYTYRFQDGQLNTSTDENAQTTTYFYNDSLNRLTNKQGPADPNNGNQHPSVTYTYKDSANTITTSELLNTTGGLRTSVSVMDGMGHVTQTQLTSDPGGIDYVDSSYNGMGQIQSVSNPYRGSALPNNTLSYLYDAIGRTIEQVQPDGSLIQWGYNGVCSTPAVTNCNAKQAGTSLSGNWTNLTDEAGHHSQQVSDSFGRLIKVVEPNPTSGALALETDYVYDALNNLTSVNQKGTSSDIPRSRSFTYDSLSRLLTAANPETGTVCYGQWSGGNCTNGYDGNSNLAYKTDARGVVTSYSYDVLNRLLSKTYTNDSAGSPWPCYQYDGSSVPNSISRLTTQWTQSASSGACSLSNTAWTKRAILQYDSMGRVLSEQQYTPATVASGTPYTPAYTYDLAGNLITSTDGVTPTPTTPGSTLTFTNCIDGANHLQTLSSNWIDNTHPQSLFSAQGSGSTPCANTSSPSVNPPAYTAFGGLTNAVLGKGLTLTRGYDNRLRIITATATGGMTSAATTGSTTITVSGAEQSQ